MKLSSRTVTSILSGALLAVFAAGCAGGADGTSFQGIASVDGDPQAASAEARTGGHGRHRGGARHASLDRNGDGTVQLSEMPEQLRARMSAADTNQDGTLSAEERTAFHRTQQEARFAQADGNSDGALTAEEAGERGWRWMSRADADHDNRVTREELSAQVQQFRGAHHRGGHGNPGAFLQRADSNHDGALEADEVGALPEAVRTRMGAADSNQDGTLSAEELTAARPGMHRGLGQGRGRGHHRAPGAPAAPAAPAAQE